MFVQGVIINRSDRHDKQLKIYNLGIVYPLIFSVVFSAAVHESNTEPVCNTAQNLRFGYQLNSLQVPGKSLEMS